MPKKLILRDRTCVVCEKTFQSPKKSRKYCSEECTSQHYKNQNRLKNEKLFEGKKEGKDFVVCNICQFKSRDLTHHINSHHGIIVKDYDGPIRSESYLKELSERVKGSKNPAYQHGGKYSPFSKKFVNAENINISELARRAQENAKKRGNSPVTIDYYIKRGMTEAEAAEALKERQRTFTLDKCIEKYGEVEGRKRWQKRQNKWLKTLDNLPEEKKKKINISKNTNKKPTTQSKPEKEMKKFFECNGFDVETQFHIIEDGKVRTYDFRYKNKIIEFHGDYWHMNPDLYGPLRKNSQIGKTAEEIWQYDQEKKILAESNGYEVMIVWERDFRENTIETLQKCLNFLTQ